MSIAQRILSNRQDSEECVNDTWYGAWKAIPPANPLSLSAFFGRITRNLAVDRLRRRTAGKRGSSEYTAALSELDELGELGECISSATNIVRQFEAAQTAGVINRWLSGLSKEKKAVFILRYFYLYSIADIADRLDISVSKTTSVLHRERIELRKALEKEGITI